MFLTAFKIINDGITNKFINGPISKEKFLEKYLGITEYIANRYSVKKVRCLYIIKIFLFVL